MPPYVLCLVDGRMRKVRFFSLPRLASDLLKALGEHQAIPKLRLQIAYGRGAGSSPAAPTTPADLTVLGQPLAAHPGSAIPWNSAAAQRVAPSEVFVREELSRENLRWARLLESRVR